MDSSVKNDVWYFDKSVPTCVPWSSPLTPALRWKFFITGVVFPLICFGFVGFADASPSIDQQWQSGDLRVYIELLLSAPAFLFFLPILAFSMICLTVWCVNPKQSKNVIVRYGLYSGFALALLFFVLLVFVTFIISPILALVNAAVLAPVVQLVKIALPKTRQFSILSMLATTTLIAVIAAVIRNVDAVYELLRQLTEVTLFFIVGGAAPLALITFMRSSIAACHIHTLLTFKTHRLHAAMFLFSWLASFTATWKFAIESVIREYEKLPTQPPQNCFVSCAAAHGHSRLVGTEKTNGTLNPVNMQMKRLKLLEFALQTIAPTFHRQVRRIYNSVGPKIASVCRSNRWLADLTYILLKPVEYAVLALAKILNISETSIRSIYK